jgi:hypothetical protein
MQINTYFPNSTKCFSDFTNITYVHTPIYTAYMKDSTNSFMNKTLYTTHYLQYWAKGLMDCDSVAMNIFTYVNNQIVVMDGFTNFLLATF